MIKERQLLSVTTAGGRRSKQIRNLDRRSAHSILEGGRPRPPGMRRSRGASRSGPVALQIGEKYFVLQGRESPSGVRHGVSIKCAGMLLAALLAVAAFVAGPALGEEVNECVINGGFETAGTNAVDGPLGWDLPDGLGVRWVSDADGDAHGRIILMDTRVSERDMVAQWKRCGITKWDIPNPAPGAISDTYGLSYYSEPFPAVSGAVYRLSFDYKGAGGAKVWVRGYGRVRGELRRVYEMWAPCRSQAGVWTRNERVFHPQSSVAEIVEFRVMLYAYYPPGLYGFDNVRVEQVPE